MDTQALRWFQQVADGVTLTEISDLEMVSQPGVSRALSRLEKEVGTPLLRKSGRTLRLTRAGDAFKRHVDAMMHSLDDGLAAVEQLIDPETGVVTLAFQPSLGTWLVPEVVRGFAAKHPGVRLHLVSKADERGPLVGDRTDVDLELSTFQAPSLSYRREHLVEEPLRLVVPSHHRLARRKQVRLADVADEPFVAIRRSSILRLEVEDLCRRTGFDPRVAYTADDLPTMRGYVAAGLGVAIMPTLRDTSAEPATPRLRYLPLDHDGASRSIWLTWSRERRLLPSAQLLRDHIVALARSRSLPHPLQPA